MAAEPSGTETGTGPDTITREELAGALREQMRTYAGVAFVVDPGKAAADIFRHVAERREPEYEPGEMYRAADGKHWEYWPHSSDAGCPWLKPGNAAAYSAIVPKRPLRRLVPEGSPLAAHERDLIHADLGELLEILGLGDHARPESPHEVFRMCLQELANWKPVDLRGVR